MKPMPVHAIICDCGVVITFPVSWEFVRCSDCKAGYRKYGDDYARIE